ncbi:hypothetical protein V5799_017132 [Amblyomma americanum]|uniref:M13 family peptidase n=1 Tax=Amblyomma americanum TaxID=6943 RepID=A0AAQ4F2Z5_AMBAM
MNTAVKPCANFYSFVCGSWKPTGKRSVIERIYANSRDIAIRELEGDPRDVPVPLAPRYFQSCMANRSEDLLKSEIEKFKSFKKGLGLKWPEEWPETGQLVQAPLKILLNLTVNWNINLLIKVRAMPPYRNRHKSVYISRGDWYRSLDRTDEQFTAIVKEHCDYLGVPPPDDLLELKAHLQAITSETLTFTSDAREEQKRTLRDINQNTVSRRDRWLQYLNEIFRPQFTWNPDDVVLIQHPGILTRLNRLLEKMPEGSFRMALSWVFIRMYMWIVIGKPELRVKGDANVLQTFRKQTCLSHVESTFGLVASASHIYERFTRKMRENLADVFDMLREHIKISFTSTSWIDDLVKKKSHEKLDGMWERVLPDNRFFSNYSLASLYRNFPEVGDSFMDNVVNIAKEFRKTLARDDYVSIFSKRLGSGRVKSRYSYYYNSVSMDVGALEPPMLYADGTLAMIYGSLGTSLAASMVRSFDQRGILFNDKGEESPWWTAGHEEYDKRVKCDLGGAADGHSPPDASPSGTFTNPLSSLVPALSATYLAYRKAIKNEGLVDVFALQGLDTYSDDQVFFMTYCLMTCATDTNGDECNVPLRHLRKFATVFGCSTGDGMNPSEKCTFFD